MAEEKTDTETKPADIEPITVSIEKTEKTVKHTCNHCGAEVIPQEVETPSGGITYKCPQCGKFMKPLTPQQLKVREEEAKGPLPPLEVLLTERVKELLQIELPRIYGIPKKDAAKTITAIIDTLSARAIMDPWNLHSHIKDFAPNANDRHLESIIEKIYDQLEEEGYLPGDQGYQPRYGARGRSGREYQPRYGPRGRLTDRYYEGDYGYEESYGPRRRPRMKVVIDGQEIETDYEGYMAHQRYKREEAEEKRKDEAHDLMMKKLEAEILKITGEVGGARAPTPGTYEEVREFIDAEGKLCDPEKAVSVRMKMIPIGHGESEVKVLRDELRGIKETIEKKEHDQLREEIKELKKKPEESEDVKALRGQLSESRKAIEDLKGSIEAKDKQTLLDKIGGLENRVSDLVASGTGEWKSDEIRLIKGGISDVKDLLQTYLSGTRPLDRAERILTGGPPGAKPPSEMATEAERGGIIEEARKHNLVTKIVERVKG